jgi:hypothetical protein
MGAGLGFAQDVAAATGIYAPSVFRYLVDSAGKLRGGMDFFGGGERG